MKLLLFFLMTTLFAMRTDILEFTPRLLPDVKKYLDERAKEFGQIPQERKTELQEVASYIAKRQRKKEKTEIIVICTHNSRRSHFGQVWLQIASYYYGLEKISTFSGGTEATACNPRTVAALQRAGLDIKSISAPDDKNPKYAARYAYNLSEMYLFSKEYTSTANPQLGFMAILVCSSANEICPVIKGADQRFYIPYEDPKISDNTPQETQTYDERCKQIAREMLYIMYCVKKSIRK
ncbi:MAG: protein-tyrosine-phosphatase [Raineya sp.]|nr:protein-tyrosine-phosphatase [Raineya sp.]